MKRVLGGIFDEQGILKILNQNSISNAKKFLEYSPSHQIDILKTAEIKGINNILRELLELPDGTPEQKMFEKKVRAFLNKRGVVGYNLIKNILQNQKVDKEILLCFVNSRIGRVNRFVQYILENGYLDEEVITNTLDRQNRQNRSLEKVKTFIKVDFHNRREREIVLKGKSIGTYFQNLGSGEKELFVSCISENRTLTKEVFEGLREVMPEKGKWFKYLLYRLDLSENGILTKPFLDYLMGSVNINFLDPLYKRISRECEYIHFLHEINSAKNLVSLVKVLDRGVYQKIDRGRIFTNLEDIIYVLRETENITEDVLIELVGLLEARIEEMDTIEPSLVFGRGITEESTLNLLYSLDLDKINRYLVSCSLTPDNLLVKLLHRGYDQEKILSNLKSESMKRTIKKILS